MIRNKLFLKALLALIILAVSISIVIWKRTSDLGPLSGAIARMPRFESIDILGRQIGSNDMKGSVVYVQFIDKPRPSDLGLLKELSASWEKEGLVLMAIVDSDNDTVAKFRTEYPKTIILNHDFERLKKLFKTPVSSMFFLFDRSGGLTMAGQTNWQSPSDLRNPLNRLLKNKTFDLSTIFPNKSRIFEHKWLGQIAEIIEKSTVSNHVIVMFARFCAGCSSGTILERLREFHEKSKGLVSVTCILSEAFTEQDASNMRAQLGLPFDVLIADRLLSDRWNWAIREYSEKEVTDIVVIIEKRGRVISLSYPDCSECWPRLLDQLGALSEGR